MFLCFPSFMLHGEVWKKWGVRPDQMGYLIAMSADPRFNQLTQLTEKTRRPIETPPFVAAKGGKERKKIKDLNVPTHVEAKHVWNKSKHGLKL